MTLTVADELEQTAALLQAEVQKAKERLRDLEFQAAQAWHEWKRATHNVRELAAEREAFEAKQAEALAIKAHNEATARLGRAERTLKEIQYE